MADGPKAPQSLPVWVWLLLASIMLSILCVGWMLATGWIHFATHSLLWDIHQTSAVSYAGLAVVFAFLVVIGVRRLSARPDSADSELDVARRKFAVAQLCAWVPLLISYVLSELRNEWHIARPIYFGLACLAVILFSSVNFLYAKKAKQGILHLMAIVWLVALFFLVARFIWGPSSEGLFK